MKICKICKIVFEPKQMAQKCCSISCAIEFARQKPIKAQQKKDRARIKSRGEWVREAQSAFNRFIRLRDSGDACISCGRNHAGQYHAGHYRSVGANPELRFEEMNCHKQCQPCNTHLSGNLVNYRINLIAKIGINAVEWLEGSHDAKKYTIDDIKAIKQKYLKACRDYEKNKNVA